MWLRPRLPLSLTAPFQMSTYPHAFSSPPLTPSPSRPPRLFQVQKKGNMKRKALGLPTKPKKPKQTATEGIEPLVPGTERERQGGSKLYRDSTSSETR